MAKETRATQALKAAQIPFTIHEYDYDPRAEHIGRHAALSLGVPPQILLKTLMIEVDGKACCVVLPSDQELSMKKAATVFGGKSANMMKREHAERITGYKIGGISPAGQMRAVPVAIEASAIEYPTIYMND